MIVWVMMWVWLSSAQQTCRYETITNTTTRSADIVFMFDISGSMSGKMAGGASRFKQFATLLAQSQIDARYSVARPHSIRHWHRQ